MSSEEWAEEWASPVDISSLELEAKQAYEQNRIRECLRLTDTLLSVHPDNETGHTLQTAISSDVDRTLNEVRGLIEERQPGTAHDRLNSAEIRLLKVLEIDPDHKGATTLLQATRALSKKVEPVQQPVSVGADVPFTVGYTPPKKESKVSRSRKPVLFVVAALAAGGLLFAKQMTRKNDPPMPYLPTVAAASPVAERKAVPSEPPAAPAITQTTPPAVPVAEKPLPVAPAVKPTPAVPTQPPSTPATVVVKAKREQVASIHLGSLAVSSPVATDIYEGEQYLGATPTILQLSAGNHTLEYRHGNLRKTVSHVVKADDTSTALITFDVLVQINAKPWANVFLEGSERQSLGQTPLSDVRLPIGRVVVFENPKFPAKTYRVTGKESSIQVVFP